MDLLSTLGTIQDVFTSVVTAIGAENEGSDAEKHENAVLDYNSFNDLFSGILQENGVISKKDDLNLNDSAVAADNANVLLEDIIVGVASSLIFNSIDKDNSKTLDQEEKDNFSSFINDMYNKNDESDIVEQAEAVLTPNLDIEA